MRKTLLSFTLLAAATLGVSGLVSHAEAAPLRLETAALVHPAHWDGEARWDGDDGRRGGWGGGGWGGGGWDGGGWREREWRRHEHWERWRRHAEWERRHEYRGW